ncbi:MAG: bifunctional folylpolyglutamate synthase/dihydrofolate synthase [Bacillota bacterium]
MPEGTVGPSTVKVMVKPSITGKEVLTMDYQEALEFLTNLTKFGINFGLERIVHLLAQLGNPHQRLKYVHVGGTNGKGSTVAMISEILKACGLKIGTFTSPHLHSYTERTRINGKVISPERVAELLTRMRPVLEKMVADGYEHPTEFEVSTALSFLFFWEENVDLVVLEVGLGGAIDSTNVIDAPLVAVITNVGMDHMDYLGHSVEEIARVKGGIIKKGCRVVTAADREEVLDIIRQTCHRQQAELYQVGREISWERMSYSIEGQYFNVNGLRRRYDQIFIPLLGEHQIVNAATAIAAIELLEFTGIKVSEEAIRHGLAQVSWPARLEIVRHNPLVLLDAAHNLDGAVTLRVALQEFFNYRGLILVIGMLADKEREKVARLLAPMATVVVVTRPLSPRAGDWNEMAEAVSECGAEVYAIEDIRDALQAALRLANEQDLICVTGSIYMVAEARRLLLFGGNE